MTSSAGQPQSVLDKLHCLFAWDKRITEHCDPDKVIISTEDKLLTADCCWRSVIYHLVLCFEYSLKEGQRERSRNHLIECVNIIHTPDWFGSDFALIERTKAALLHVIYASWVHLTLQTHSVNEIKDYLEEIPEYKRLSKKEKAAVWGIRSACLMQFGKEGNSAAEKFIEQALKFDVTEPEWHYLKGEILRGERIRHNNEEQVPSAQEIEALETAALNDPSSPAYLIGLASSLYDKARKEKSVSESRNRATRLYKSALELNPNSAYVQLMCASGLLDYAYPVRETALADQCLTKALELAPTSCHANIVAAAFYWWPAKKKSIAVGHLNKARKRYKDLVQKITESTIPSYRTVLRDALWGEKLQDDVVDLDREHYIL